MTQVIKLRVDLATTAGRAAMRAYLDALDRGDDRPAARGMEPHHELSITADPEAGCDPMRAGVNRSLDGGNLTKGGIGSPGRGHCESVAIPGMEDVDPGPVPIEPAGVEGPVKEAVKAPVKAPVKAADAAADGAVDPGLDPERKWTPGLKREVWRRWQDGQQPAAIARALTLRAPRVYQKIWLWKRGKQRPPEGEQATATALVPVNATAGALALALAARRPAQDEGMRARRLEEMAQAEREKFVARSLAEGPETQP